MQQTTIERTFPPLRLHGRTEAGIDKDTITFDLSLHRGNAEGISPLEAEMEAAGFTVERLDIPTREFSLRCNGSFAQVERTFGIRPVHFYPSATGDDVEDDAAMKSFRFNGDFQVAEHLNDIPFAFSLPEQPALFTTDAAVAKSPIGHA